MNGEWRRISLAMMVLPLAWAGGCSGGDVDTEPVLRPVRTEQVFATGGGRVRMFSGIAKSGVESKLSFKVGGTLQRLYVRVGETVQKGQPIAELDPEDYPTRRFSPSPGHLAGAAGLIAVGFALTLGLSRIGGREPDSA